MKKENPTPSGQEPKSRNSHFRRWGAAYLLFGLFLGSLGGQFFSQVAEVRNEVAQHGQEFAWPDFWPRFLSATFENWQSEWLQLFVQAVVLLGMKHVLFKADAEDMEQVQHDLTEIKQHLGIPPRDEPTAAEVREVEAIKEGS